MAIEAADIALFTNDLRCLDALMALAHIVQRKVLENVAFAVTTKVRNVPGRGSNLLHVLARGWHAVLKRGQ